MAVTVIIFFFYSVYLRCPFKLLVDYRISDIQQTIYRDFFFLMKKLLRISGEQGK